jgi:nitrate reductase gamma subunit
MNAHTLLFGALPYVVAAIAVIGTLARYKNNKYSYSSLSSQFLENKLLFWGTVPFHYGILIVLAGHIVAFCIPRSVLVWNSVPLRLYILEISALALGLAALWGLLVLLLRRIIFPRVRAVTSAMDIAVLIALLAQVATGVGIAILYRWGSSWFAGAMTPYLWSLVKLQPRTEFIAPLPLLIKTHILGSFVLLALLPFSRLVHVLALPLEYLWRPFQVARWNRRPGMIADEQTAQARIR